MNTQHLDDDLSEFDDLRAFMDDALTDLDVPVRRLHERSGAAGRRLRRRRHALVAVGGLAAAATAAAFVVPLAGGSGSTARDDGFAGSPAASPTATPTGLPTPAADPPAPFVDRPGWWDMPAAEVASRLAGQLPKDATLTSYERTNTDHAPGESDAFIGYLNGTLTGRHGPGGVNLILAQLPDRAVLDDAGEQGADDVSFGCPPAVSSPDVQVLTCTTRGDAAGHVVERRLETVHDGVTTREVRLTTHGGSIYVSTANSTQRKWDAPTSASEPPLTLAQLARIATSTTWTDWQRSGG